MKETLYTLRWLAKKILGTTTEQSTKDLVQEQIELITKEIGGESKQEPAAEKAPLGKGLKRFPFATQHGKMKERGTYALGYPRGAVVHYTAGRSGGLKKAMSAVDYGATQGHTYLVIGSDGSLVQAHDIDKYGYHAGNSKYTNAIKKLFLLDTVSDDLIGFEINNAGKVEKIGEGRYQTYFKTYLTEDEVRFVDGKEWGCPAGYYHKYTPEQEATLVKAILFLKQNDPVGCFDLDLVLGHNEVSPGRKPDPDGALSMPMEKFREHLKKEYAKLV